MPQAAIAGVLEAVGIVGVSAATLTLIQTVLINLALGSFEYVDEHGERWTVVR